MKIFKCKMCGGTLEITNNESVATCQYCGTQQTLPKLEDDHIANMYDRANHFRRNSEFDKATKIYEQILNEDNTDAEAYWSLVLCRYGIEYVEDPVSHNRVPTVNIAQFTSIYDDYNYKAALKYADENQRYIYEDEAKAINKIQKEILAISQNEEPFDVFICYKESDQTGQRTYDSVLANDLYHQLTQEGFKVFFARITLEDKLGEAYEPYIFAALNSAKVMIVLATKPEYFNAVWVRNEWSRYLALIKQGQKKTLIPAYKDMDPYDLPDEFAHLQAQDMSKLGFIPDLIRGITKIINQDNPQKGIQESVVNSVNTTIEPLLKRAYMFLEDGEFKLADEYCEKVLDIDPENGQAYFGKLMVEYEVRHKEDFCGISKLLAGNNYSKAKRFGNQEIKDDLERYDICIRKNKDYEKRSNIYREASLLINQAAKTEDLVKIKSIYEKASKLFKSIDVFNGADELAIECDQKAKEYGEKIEEVRKNDILSKAIDQMLGEKLENYEAAMKMFESIPGWKDADELSSKCHEKIIEIRNTEEAERQKKMLKKKKILSCIGLGILSIIVIITILSVKSNFQKYNKAIDLMNEGNITEAYTNFLALDGFKDSEKMVDELGSELMKPIVDKIKAGEKEVYFGLYPGISADEALVKWKVLEVEDDKALLLGDSIRLKKYYDKPADLISWKESSLREWLNYSYINDSFKDYEKAAILETDVCTLEKENRGTDYYTEDYIFILSADELEKYSINAKDNMWIRGSVVHDSYKTKDVEIQNKRVYPAMWISLK